MDRDACRMGLTGSHTFVCGRRKWFTRTGVRLFARGPGGPPQIQCGLTHVLVLELFPDSLRPVRPTALWRGIGPARTLEGRSR
jgi:hypothetical protein